MNDKPRDEIEYLPYRQFTMPGVAFASDPTVIAQTSCILERTE